jgi:hypothetical protein
MVFDAKDKDEAHKLDYGLYCAVVEDEEFVLPPKGDPIFMGYLHKDVPVLNVYAYGDPGVGEAEVVRRARIALDKMGVELGELHACRQWRYFPHATPKAIEDGFYETYEGLQGENATWWAGSTASFECVEDSMDYMEDLVDRDF